jgi:hypothetical protein
MRKILLVLLLSATAFTTHLRAQIIDNLTPYSFTNGAGVINTTGTSLFIGAYDTTNGGANNFWVVGADEMFPGLDLEYATTSVQWLTGGPVAPGSVIDDSGTYGGNFFTPASSFTDLYYGLNYTISPGSVEYGWAEISFDSTSNTGTIVGAGLQTTPNDSIVAGAVPEPSTWSVFALGAATLVFEVHPAGVEPTTFGFGGPRSTE